MRQTERWPRLIPLREPPMPEGTPIDPRRPEADRPVEPPTPRLQEALDPRSAPAEVDARGYGPIMTASRFADRFRFYNDQPQQARGVWILYDEIMALQGGRAILSEDSNWAVEFSSAPPPPPKPAFTNPLQLKWQSQLDNSSGMGHRECFSSSMAMIAMFWGKIDNDDSYNAVRARYGDTTDSNAQVRALQSLGLDARFITNASAQMVKDEILAGRPVGGGWLHQGPVSNPSGGGHWSVFSGFGDTYWVVEDPNGEADLKNGGYTPITNGAQRRYSFANFNPRFLVGGPNDAWIMTVRPA